MADCIRGNSVSVVKAALAVLVDDPEQLDRTRKRFMVSPPSDALQSHNSTRSESPDAPNKEQQRRDKRQLQLQIGRTASLPDKQLSYQVFEEKKRIIEAVEHQKLHVPVSTSHYKLTKEAVRKRWVKQGIWNDKWNDMAQGRWKHEEPSDLSIEPEARAEEQAKT